MQVCKCRSVQICKCASMQVCKYVRLHVYKYASVQVCKGASMQVCKIFFGLQFLPHSSPTWDFNSAWNLAKLQLASWTTKWLILLRCDDPAAQPPPNEISHLETYKPCNYCQNPIVDFFFSVDTDPLFWIFLTFLFWWLPLLNWHDFWYCHNRAPSWIFSLAENLASSSLQDGATKWIYYVAGTTHPPTNPPSPLH